MPRAGRRLPAVRSISLGSLILGLCLLAPAASARATTTAFGYTDTEEAFTVPAGITSVHVLAVGGKGGTKPGGGVGGFGATASADLAVVPGETLYIDVGSNGTGDAEVNPSGGLGGFNGGGGGGDAAINGGAGGGGASDIASEPRTNPASDSVGNNLGSRLVTAGGGGGGGAAALAMAGAGGAAGSAGSKESVTGFPGEGGGAGTASMGGAAGHPGVPKSSVAGPGALGAGGEGGSDVPEPVPNPNSESLTYSCGGGGGGGGGGLFGGGGGGLGGSDPLCAPPIAGGGGGGGGSSGFGAGVTNASVGVDTTGTPSITLTYSPSASKGEGAGNGERSQAGGFSLGKVKDNRKQGTATVVANLPGAGVLVLSGKGVRKATTTAPGAGALKLTVRPTGKAKAALARSGRIKVRVSVAFTPERGAPPPALSIPVVLVRRKG